MSVACSGEKPFYIPTGQCFDGTLGPGSYSQPIERSQDDTCLTQLHTLLFKKGRL
jgi:hypothetical protein